MVRFAILYFAMLLLFIILIAAPVIVHNQNLAKSFLKGLWSSIGVNGKNGGMMALLQPLDKGVNDTESYYTGSNIPKGYSPTDNTATPYASGTYAYVGKKI